MICMGNLPKMSYQLVIVLCVQLTSMSAAPLLLLPIPWAAQSTSQVVLQKQLMELQALQQLSAQSFLQTNNQPQPFMVLLPNEQLNPNININQRVQYNENAHKSAHTNHENEEDLNSIVIDAATDNGDMEEVTKNQNQPMHSQPQRALILLPNGRLSIGEIISAIPFLPIEINVPDTISWAYNGIASGIGSIISIIGRPFQGTQEAPIPEASLKSLLNQIQMKQNAVRPIIMMPIDGPVLPIQV